MDRLISLLIFTVVFGLIPGPLLLAEPAPLYNTGDPFGGFNATAEAAGQGTTMNTNLGSLTGNIVGVILSALGIIVLGYLIYGGVLWMTAAGNEDQVTKAKSIIRNGIIGVMVIASAYAISYFIITQVGGAVGIR